MLQSRSLSTYYEELETGNKIQPATWTLFGVLHINTCKLLIVLLQPDCPFDRLKWRDIVIGTVTRKDIVVSMEKNLP